MRSDRRTTLIAIIIAALTFIAYLPALQNGFVNWDDQEYVNEGLRAFPIGLEYLKWVLSTPVCANWHPLTVLSHTAITKIWGLNPLPHILVNIIFHSLNTFLVALLAVKLIALGCDVPGDGVSRRTLYAGAAAALLFGLHPIHVESVAWVSERKDVLSVFFFLLSVSSYLQYADAGKKRHCAYAFIFFLLALLSKPMAITLPLVLLILDYYPLRRMARTSGLVRLSIEKIPFFILCAATVGLTIWAQKHALTATRMTDLSVRLFVALRGFFFYIYKMILPAGLSPYYPHPYEIQIFSLEYLGSLAMFIAVSAFCLIKAKRQKAFIAVWFFYVVTLLPVVGIIQVGGQAAADRYAYLPSVGPFILTGLAIGHILDRYVRRTGSIAAVWILMTFVLGALTVKQVAVWKDSGTLWTQDIKYYPTPFAFISRAKFYHLDGRLKEAIRDYTTVLENADPAAYAELYLRRGLARMTLGDHAGAISDFTAFLSTNPEDPRAYNNRGNAYKGLGDYSLAVKDYETAAMLDPGNKAIYFNLGQTYMKTGNKPLGLANMQKAAGLGMKEAEDFLRSYDNNGQAGVD